MSFEKFSWSFRPIPLSRQMMTTRKNNRTRDLLDVRQLWQRQQNATSPRAPRCTPIPKPDGPILDLSAFQNSVNSCIMQDNQRLQGGLKPMDLYIKSNPGLLSGMDATNPRDWHHSVTKTHLLRTFVDNYRKIQVVDRDSKMAVFMSLPALKGVDQLSKSLTTNKQFSNPKSKLTRVNRDKKLNKTTQSLDRLNQLPPIHKSENADPGDKNSTPTFLTEARVSLSQHNNLNSDEINPVKSFGGILPSINAKVSMSDSKIKSVDSTLSLNMAADLTKIRENIRHFSQKVPDVAAPMPIPKQLNPMPERYRELRDVKRKHVPPVEAIEHGDHYKMKQKSLLKLKLSERDVINIVNETQPHHHGNIMASAQDLPDWSKVQSKLAQNLGLTRPTKAMSVASSTFSLSSIPKLELQEPNHLDDLLIESQTAPSIRRGDESRTLKKGDESRSTFHGTITDSESGKSVGKYVYTSRKSETKKTSKPKVTAVNITILDSGSLESKRATKRTKLSNATKDITASSVDESAQSTESDDQKSVSSDTQRKKTLSETSNKLEDTKQKITLTKFKKLEIFESKSKSRDPEPQNNQTESSTEQKKKRKEYLPLTRPPQYKMADPPKLFPQYYPKRTEYIDLYDELYVGLCECMLCPECKGIEEELLSIQDGSRHLPKNPPNSLSSHRRKIRRGSDVTDSSTQPSLIPHSKGASKAPSAKTITEEVNEEWPHLNTSNNHGIAENEQEHLPSDLSPDGSSSVTMGAPSCKSHQTETIPDDSSKSTSVRYTCNTDDFLRPSHTTTTTTVYTD